MKLKYYLLGVGVGLILAVVIYSTIIIPRKYQMTDEEVIRRAQELGMVRVEETDVDLSALSGTPSPTGEGTPTPSGGSDILPDGEEEPVTPPAAPDENPDADPTVLAMPDENLDADPVMPEKDPNADPTMPVMPEQGQNADPIMPEGDQNADPTMPVMTKEDQNAGPTMPAMPEGDPNAGPTMPAMPEGDPNAGPTMPAMPEGDPNAGPTMPAMPDAGPTMPVMPVMPTMPPVTAAPDTTQEEDGRISVTITNGMSSEAFALELQKAGIIEEAADFDLYLMQNNYALYIRPGTYRFLPGTAYEEIAGRVTAN